VAPVAEAVTLAKAKLVELDAAFKDPAPGGRTVTVQFNPDTLKVTYANRTQQPQSAGDQRGNAPRQVVGAGSSKLALQLWFDVNGTDAGGVRDVRQLTRPVTAFMLPASPSGGGGGTNQPAPPGVRFLWGTFRFDGLMDSAEETLDFFSPDGRPLRASVSIGLSGQVEIVPPEGGAASPAAAAGPTPGTRPLTPVPAGGTLPGLVAALGVGVDWQDVAAANGIENPRLPAVGVLLDLDVRGTLQ
jgi:Contractile injection system tube protein